MYAGLAPGPLFTLVIAQTLKHNVVEGMKVAIAPLFSDAPVIIVSILAISYLSSIGPLLGLLSIVGGCFVTYLAYDTFMQKPVELHLDEEVQPRSYSKGIITNLLNPHPYLFWFSVGGPLIIKGYQQQAANAVYFFVSFYILIVGGKLLVAVITDRFRNFLSSQYYLLTMKTLGIVLFTFALFLFKEGITNLR